MLKPIIIPLSITLSFSPVYAQDVESQNTDIEPLEIIIPYCDKSQSCKVIAATRFPIDPIESPRTVDTLTSTTLDDNNALRTEEVISYIPGVTPGVTQAGFNTSVVIRGFGTEDQVFVNGHRDNQGFFIRDFSTIQRVEVLKGHSAVLYGSGAPGGALNYITKKPTTNQRNNLSLTLGNRDLRHVSVDSTGPLNEDQSIAYRFIASGQKADHFYDNADNDNWTVAPSLLWQYSDKGQIGLELEAAHRNTPFLFGTVYTNGEFLFDQSYIDPRAKSDRDFEHARLYWDHGLFGQWSIHTALATYKTKRDDRHIGFFFKQSEDLLRGYYREVKDDYSQYVLRTELHGEGLGNNIKHNLIIGVERNKDNAHVQAYQITDFTLDPYTPQFDTDFSELEGDARDFRIRNDEVGLYTLDKIDLTKNFSLYLGGRYSSYETDFVEEQDNRLRDQHTFSKSIAFNYHPDEYFSIYGSVSESFSPNSGQDRDNNFFDPKEAVQYELGIKKTIPDSKLSLAASVFRITQDNLLTSGPEDRDFKILAGEQRHQGIELAAIYSPNEQVQISAGYAYLDAEITQSNDGVKGNTPPNAPKHSGYLKMDYFPVSSPHWRFSAGIIGVDQRQGDRNNSFTVPSYGRVDLGAHYTRNNKTFSVTATNVFDKDYIAASYLQDDLYQGTPRTVIAKLSIDF